MEEDLERLACNPVLLNPGDLNPKANLPYGCTVEHGYRAMQEFVEFLGFVNRQLHTRQIPRLESLLMPANFSSIVGEFMTVSIPKYCAALTKNQYHNGHPDLCPAGRFPGNAAQHTSEGIEIKGSRYRSGWQGHNPEDVWLMVFVFDSNRPRDTQPWPFRFLEVVGARLTKADWTYSGRSETSRRTITASVNQVGYQKMQENWIYRSSG